LEDAPFDTLRCSGSVASNNNFGSQKPKTKTFKKENNFARQRGLSAKLSKAGYSNNAPFDKNSGSGASNNSIGLQKLLNTNVQKRESLHKPAA